MSLSCILREIIRDSAVDWPKSPGQTVSQVDASCQRTVSASGVWPLLAFLKYLWYLHALALVRAQIRMQVNARFSPFGHPTQVDTSWSQVTCIYAWNLRLFTTCVSLRAHARLVSATCESVWPGETTIIHPLSSPETFPRMRHILKRAFSWLQLNRSSNSNGLTEAGIWVKFIRVTQFLQMSKHRRDASWNPRNRPCVFNFLDFWI